MIDSAQLKRVLDRDFSFHDHVITVNVIPVTSDSKVIEYYRVKFSSSTNPRLVNIIVETELKRAVDRVVDEFPKFYQLCLDNQGLKSKIRSNFKHDVVVHGTENTNVFEIIVKDNNFSTNVLDTMKSVAKVLNVILYLKQRGG